MSDYFEAKENELSKKLRSFCDDDGGEKDSCVEASGQVFNELGLLYKTKSPDKISLIQSAALLNAAIVRQPSNAKFHEDLKELCRHVLECPVPVERMRICCKYQNISIAWLKK